MSQPRVDPRGVERHLACLLLTAASLAVMFGQSRRTKRAMESKSGVGKDRIRAMVITTLLMCMIPWPLIWRHVVGRENAPRPALIACMVWAVLLTLVDVLAATAGEPPRSGMPETFHSNTLVTQAGGLVGMSFSVAAIISQSSSREQHPPRHIVLLALLLCVGAIIPQPITRLDEGTREYAYAVQKAAFNCSVAMIMTGIVVCVTGERPVGGGSNKTT